MANLIWEAARRRSRGETLDYGTEHRGFYYRRNLAVLPLPVKHLSPASLKQADEFLVTNPMLSALCAATWQELEIDFDDDGAPDDDAEFDEET